MALIQDTKPKIKNNKPIIRMEINVSRRVNALTSTVLVNAVLILQVNSCWLRFSGSPIAKRKNTGQGNRYMPDDFVKYWPGKDY